MYLIPISANIRTMDPEPRARPRWRRIGAWLTAAWIALVLVVSEGRITHPLFDYIFMVPLAAWIVALLVARAVARRRNR